MACQHLSFTIKRCHICGVSELLVGLAVLSRFSLDEQVNAFVAAGVADPTLESVAATLPFPLDRFQEKALVAFLQGEGVHSELICGLPVSDACSAACPSWVLTLYSNIA